MKIVIVGDGKIGSTLAQQLSQENHDITVIDRESSTLEQTAQELDILCVEGNGATHSVQLEAGVDQADLLIAVTNSDELNLLCCLMAKKIGAHHTIARVRNPEYATELRLISEDLGLSLSVNPELTCSNEIARNLRIPSAIKSDTFARGHVELLKFQLAPDSPLVGKALMELPTVVKARVLICAVERGEDEIHIPSGPFRLQAGDRISLVAPMQEARAFFRQLGLETDPIRQVLIVGGGRIAYYLARQLLDAGLSVKIIERDYARCEQLSVLLPKATILHGDGTSERFLLESGLENTDAFVSMTGIDEENVLMSMYVRKALPKVKVITKLDRLSFRSILDNMDLGSVYNPRTSTANQICRFVRTMENSLGSSVETLYKLCDGKAEALEFRVAKGSAVCSIPLMELRLKPGILIAAINRGGRIRIPSGRDTIEPGDTVIVVTSTIGLSELDAILRTEG